MLPLCLAQIPVDYEWPIELSGMQLGSICKQMRIGDIWAKHVRCSGGSDPSLPQSEKRPTESTHDSRTACPTVFLFRDPVNVFVRQYRRMRWVSCE